ncbi:glycosyl hydrolase family 18 [Cryobacterium breve]|uniref:Glycosyl hydrolase family 18 n=1 Tax=Cryobacterium breve TaxID=1259258 RepID=A0ABY2IXM7_9MICO|nr:glycosyl hydrolase family 18 [Cryobacterium sp. TmT3-12]TFC96433.1 glycosyl hydrolase family 18 [Cryobacterium breve]
MSKRFPGRKLSLVRVLALGVAAGAVVVGAGYGWSGFEDSRAAAAGSSGFAGYVDVTATPTYAFERPVSDEAANVVLSFIVADPDEECTPTWGASQSLGEAEINLDLDRRIARLVGDGGEVSVSFGGLANDELATVCTDADKLTRAYAAVVDRYNLTSIDLDVEGDNLTDAAAGERRAEAVAALQKKRHAAGEDLTVWLTLPVAQTGLTEDGLVAVQQMLDADVDLAGVNVMTMDFGGKRPTSMLDASIAAAEATHAQLADLYESNDLAIGSQTLWRQIGVTPMIGQNDVPGEIFTLEDAAGLNTFARAKGLGRVSLWSLNRDSTCAPNYPDVTRVSDGCSGVDQGDALFVDVLGQGITGQLDSDVVEEEPTASAEVVDDPATSPYPIWDEEVAYVKADRIVWHGNVYAAKWWTTGDLPDDPSAASSDVAWDLIGPVLPGDRPVPVLTVPAGTYPEWSTEIVYQQGDLVLFSDRVLIAKWWNRSDSPQAALEGATASPWRLLKNEEVQDILSELAAAEPTAETTAEPTQ